MELEIIDKLSALAHEKRLALFRLLVRRFPDVVPAGEIAEALGYKANTTSTYLTILRSAGLIQQSRSGTSLNYQASLEGLQGMFDTLLSDCCQNRPNICAAQNLTPLPAPSSERPMNVMFICSGNSARSLLAEALLNGEGNGRFRGFSAGISPTGTPHAEALSALTARGYDIRSLSSKGLAPFLVDKAPQMDIVITVCNQAANEEPPAWPGQPLRSHWGVPNPVSDPQNTKLAMRNAFDVLKHRIQALTWLPFDRLNRQELQHRIDEIGRLSPFSNSSLNQGT